MRWAALALSLECQLFVGVTGVRDTVSTSAINISVVGAIFASTVLVEALVCLAGIPHTVLSGRIWVRKFLAISTFSIHFELLSASAGILNAGSCGVDVIVIRAYLALVILDVHLVLLRVAVFAPPQSV
jgi:hypothetical protein